MSLLAEGDSFFHVPSIAEFFPDAILFGGTWFEFNRVQLVRLIVIAVVLTATCIIASRAKIVPGRVQSIVELLMEFVNNTVIQNTLGLREGRKFAPDAHHDVLLHLRDESRRGGRPPASTWPAPR